MNATAEKDASPPEDSEATEVPEISRDNQPGLESREILEVVGNAVRDHMEWLHRFHRSMICNLSPERDVISYQAHYLCAFGAWLDLHTEDRLVTQPAFAVRFIENLRPYDMVFRYGGEEFLICMPNADTETALVILERLRSAMADEPVLVENEDQEPGDRDKELRVTASFGLATLDGETSLKQILARADEALYQAKEGGRNRVCLWSPSGESGEDDGEGEDDAESGDGNDGG